MSFVWPLLALLAPASAPDVLATYAGGTVTRAEYESLLAAESLQDAPEALRDRLEAVALSETLEAAAVAAGLDRRPGVAFRLAQVETRLLHAALVQEADRAVVVTDAAVEAELKAEEKERFRPRTYRLRNIFKRVPPDATPAQRAELRVRTEDLRKALAAGADFEEMAWRESDSQTRFRGGALGYVPAGVLAPDVDRVMVSMKKGDLSPVLASADGFTILRCDDVAEGREIPLDEARTTIRNGLWRRASLARQGELRAELLRAAAPRYPDGAPDDASPVAELAGGLRVTRAELRWLGDTDASSAASRRALLEEQVVALAAAARARAQGLDRDPRFLARARWQRARLLATEEMARRVNARLVPPSDAEMRAHFQQHRDRYASPVRVDVSLVSWPAERARQKEAFARAESVAARLRSGALAFDRAAREESSHPSAAQGGRLGLLDMTDLAPLGPNVYRTVESLASGETSPLVQQDETLYVLKLWERRPSRPLTYEEAAGRVEKELGDARVAALQERLEAEARQALALLTPSPSAP